MKKLAFVFAVVAMLGITPSQAASTETVPQSVEKKTAEVSNSWGVRVGGWRFGYGRRGGYWGYGYRRGYYGRPYYRGYRGYYYYPGYGYYYRY